MAAATAVLTARKRKFLNRGRFLLGTDIVVDQAYDYKIWRYCPQVQSRIRHNCRVLHRCAASIDQPDTL